MIAGLHVEGTVPLPTLAFTLYHRLSRILGYGMAARCAPVRILCSFLPYLSVSDDPVTPCPTSSFRVI